MQIINLIFLFQLCVMLLASYNMLPNSRYVANQKQTVAIATIFYVMFMVIPNSFYVINSNACIILCSDI